MIAGGFFEDRRTLGSGSGLIGISCAIVQYRDKYGAADAEHALAIGQFEREITAGRIWDKIAASKKTGLWMGGSVPLGQEPDGRTLKTKEPDARIIRTVYNLRGQHKNIRATKEGAHTLGSGPQ